MRKKFLIGLVVFLIGLCGGLLLFSFSKYRKKEDVRFSASTASTETTENEIFSDFGSPRPGFPTSFFVLSEDQLRQFSEDNYLVASTIKIEGTFVGWVKQNSNIYLVLADLDEKNEKAYIPITFPEKWEQTSSYLYSLQFVFENGRIYDFFSADWKDRNKVFMKSKKIKISYDIDNPKNGNNFLLPETIVIVN